MEFVGKGIKKSNGTEAKIKTNAQQNVYAIAG